jgi:hypothetical protein
MLRKDGQNSENLSHNSLCACRNSNLAPPEYTPELAEFYERYFCL